MPANLSSKALSQPGVWTEASDHVVIVRRTLGSGVNPTYVNVTIFDGYADFQDSVGSLAYNPSGPVDSVAARVVIDPLADGTLPSVLIDDEVTVNAQTYTVTGSTPCYMVPVHLKVDLKRGPLTSSYKGQGL